MNGPDGQVGQGCDVRPCDVAGLGAWAWVTFTARGPVPHLLLAPHPTHETTHQLDLRMRLLCHRIGLGPLLDGRPSPVPLPDCRVSLGTGPTPEAVLRLGNGDAPVPLSVGSTWVACARTGAPVLVLAGLDALPATAGQRRVDRYVAARGPCGRLRGGLARAGVPEGV
ncbi:hypothetical protein [Streptomyces sp. NPDC007088]|uniref:hypothetical protein n=1 Tax=Streptomyces sp. NPDC007088 TaxID=3364773 RepID=UPI0036CCA303